MHKNTTFTTTITTLNSFNISRSNIRNIWGYDAKRMKPKIEEQTKQWLKERGQKENTTQTSKNWANHSSAPAGQTVCYTIYYSSCYSA